MSELDERIARGLALREQHPAWSMRTILAALDHGEDSPEVRASIARSVALMERLTEPPVTDPRVTDEQVRVLRKMIDGSVRITIYHGEPPGIVGVDSQPLLGPRGSVWVERRATTGAFGWSVIEPDGSVRT